MNHKTASIEFGGLAVWEAAKGLYCVATGQWGAAARCFLFSFVHSANATNEAVLSKVFDK